MGTLNEPSGVYESMNWADWAIVGVFSLSCIIGLVRGFVREALSLAVWLAAALVARLFGPRLEILLIDHIDTPSLRIVTAYAVLFVVTLILGSLVIYLISALVRATGLSGTDRLLGMIFGALRAFVIVVALVIFLPGFLPVDQDGWWHQSRLIPYFVDCESWVKSVYSEVSQILGALFGSAPQTGISI